MKKLPKTLLILSVLLALVEFIPGLNNAFYTIHRPLSAVFFGLFLVTMVMGKEAELYDADHLSGSHGKRKED